MNTFVCVHCKKEKLVNIKLKHKQYYCSDIVCQRARKAKWQREKLKNDLSYRERQKECQAKWRKHRPSDRYQARYRSAHPDYVEKNRVLQLKQNKKHKFHHYPSSGKDCKDGHVNSVCQVRSGLYHIIPTNKGKSEKIVKMDTLVAQLQIIPGAALNLHDNCKDGHYCKEDHAGVF